MHPALKKFDPAVDKRFLIVISGIIWSVVGVLLCNLSIGWLSEAVNSGTIWIGIAGIILALLIHQLGFLRLVNRNIERILLAKNKICIFAFQPWRSYIIIIIMIGIGIILRHSPVPKPYLSIIYTGFGGAMILSSIRYYRVFFKLIL